MALLQYLGKTRIEHEAATLPFNTHFAALSADNLAISPLTCRSLPLVKQRVRAIGWLDNVATT